MNQELIERIFASQPLYMWITEHLIIGTVIGLNIKFFTARHLWNKHKVTDNYSYECLNCWCGVNGVLALPIFAAMWAAPVLWPLTIAVAVVFVLPFMLYSKALEFVNNFAIKAPKRKHDAIVSKHAEEMAEMYRVRNELMTKVGSLVVELAKLKEDSHIHQETDADKRVDQKLAESQKILEEIDKRPVD